MMKKISAILISCVVSVLIIHQTTVAGTYSITRLTNNDIPDGGQQISDNGVVVYVSPSMSSTDGDIFLYNSATGNTVQLFENDDRGDTNPIVNTVGDIVWKRSIGSVEQLFLYDRSTSPPNIIQITNSSSDVYGPHINNNRDIVYSTRPSDGSDFEVFLYVRESGVTLRLTDNEEYDGAPKICGSGDVVWTHNDGDDEVYLYKRSSGQVLALSDNDYQDYYIGYDAVNARGDVAWRATMPGSNYEIFIYDSVSNKVTQFENVTCDDYNPAINDNGDLVWSMSCPGTDREIMIYNGVSKTVKPLTKNSWDDYSPNINNNRDVVWKGNSDNHFSYDIYVYHSSDESISKLTDTVAEEFSINFNNNSQIVWNAQSGIGSDSFEIFLASPTKLENGGNPMAWMLLLLNSDSDK